MAKENGAFELLETERKVIKEALEMYAKSAIRAQKAAPNPVIADAWAKSVVSIRQLADKF